MDNAEKERWRAAVRMVVEEQNPTFYHYVVTCLAPKKYNVDSMTLWMTKDLVTHYGVSPDDIPYLIQCLPFLPKFDVLDGTWDQQMQLYRQVIEEAKKTERLMEGEQNATSD